MPTFMPNPEMHDFLKRYHLLTAFFIALLVVGFSFGKLVTQPWYGIVELGGDGMKNMYNYLYECEYGSGIWYYGMNYPYGEHMVYTDGLPLLSVFFAKVGHITPETAMTVLWWAIALSWALAIWYVYRILTHFTVKPVLAIVFASLIVMMSPQVIRLTGHYSLSFACVIPMLFYWSVRYHEGKEIRYAISIGLLGIFACLMHPYFSAMVLLWVAAYCGGYMLLITAPVSQKLKKITPILISGAAVIIFFKGFMALTDPIKDRAIQPFGFLEYKARIKELVTSDYSWFWHFVTRNHLVRLTSYYGEGTAYLGLTVTIVATIGIVCLLYSVLFRKKRIADVLPVGFHTIWLFIGGIILLFSMGVPFVYHLEWLTDYLTFFRQFRSLGRFDWIFYFVATIYAALVLNKWLIQIASNRVAVIALLICALGLWVSETRSYISRIRSIGGRAKNYYDHTLIPTAWDWGKWLNACHYKPEDFQAILSWGIVNIGTEKYWVGDHGMWGMSLCEIAALRLHLPVMDANLSRTSWSISRKQTKLASGPFADKAVLADLKSSKPILLIQFQNDTLSPDETYLLGAADYIGNFDYCHLYALYPERLLKIDATMKDSVLNVAKQMKGTDTCIGNNANVYLDHFDKYPNKNSLYGTGARVKSNDTVLAYITISNCDTQTYEFSAWFLVDSTTWANPVLTLYFYDSAGRLLSSRDILTRTCTEHDGLWSRANAYIKLIPQTSRIVCGLLKQPFKDYILSDEVQFRPQNSLIISRLNDGKIMANNHWLK